MAVNDENSIADLRSDLDKLGIAESKVRKMNTLQQFEVGRCLGKGKFGNVFLSRYIETGFVMAMKVLKKSTIDKYNMTEQLEREISIQYHLRHENILRLFSYFHDTDRLYILLEYCDGGTLMQKMRKQKNKFTEPQAAFYIDQIASALIHCHERNVFHRDLKLENILIATNGVLKLADFGWSVKETGTDNSRRTTTCGTLDYLSPEMLSDCPHDRYVDNWSVGILLYEFLYGVGPFVVADQYETLQRIKKVDYEFPENFPEGAKDIVSKLLVREPQARMELHDLKKHWWTVEEGKKYEVKKL